MSALRRLIVVALVAAFGAGALLAVPAQGASGYGYDISYPQCGKTLPSSAAFAVLGVNGGIPFKDNACLGEQFRWVQRTHADYGFYVNSSNPGSSHSQWAVAGPMVCGGTSTDVGCAYNFGQAAAKEAYEYAARVTRAVAGHRFWVDVETANSWSKTNSVANVAVLQGMVDYLTVRSGRIAGIYATPNHWTRIASNAQAASVPNWFAAAKDRNAAAAKCAGGGSLTGGPLLIVQYVAKGIDHDYWCGRSVA